MRDNARASYYIITTFFSFLAAGFCPKNSGFARIRGLQSSHTLAHTPMILMNNNNTERIKNNTYDNNDNNEI